LAEECNKIQGKNMLKASVFLAAMACMVWVPGLARTAEATSVIRAQAVDGQSESYPTWAVLIDRETGFSYIKTPGGFKFIRRLSLAQTRLALDAYPEQEIRRHNEACQTV
jgi:hypothetical protein